MRLSPADSWEVRLTHLGNIRALQDLTSGFRCFFTELAAGWRDAAAAETKIRATCIARLFLDNVHSIHEESLRPADTAGALCLWCGVNEIRLDMSAGRESEIRETLIMLRSLCDGGMDFQPRSFEERLTREVH